MLPADARTTVSVSRNRCSNAWLIRLQWTALRQALVDEIEPKKDSLRFYFLGKNWKNRVEHVGARPSYDPQGPLVV